MSLCPFLLLFYENSITRLFHYRIQNMLRICTATVSSVLIVNSSVLLHISFLQQTVDLKVP